MLIARIANVEACIAQAAKTYDAMATAMQRLSDRLSSIEYPAQQVTAIGTQYDAMIESNPGIALPQ